MSDGIDAVPDEPGEVCDFGGIAYGLFHGIALDDDETVHTVRTSCQPLIFLAGETAVEADVERGMVGIVQYIFGREVVQSTVTQFNGGDVPEGLPDNGQIIHAVQDGADVEELLHNLHRKGLFTLKKRNAGGVGCEGSEFVAEHIFHTGALDHNRISLGLEQRAGDGKAHDLVVAYVLIQDVQKDGIVGMPCRIGDFVFVFGMGLGNSRAGNVLYLFGVSESVSLRILSQVFFDVQAGRADDIHVDGESPGTAQVEHQGRAAFEDEGAAGEFEGFQQGEGADGFLKEGDVLDVGYWERRDSIHALVRLSGLIIILDVYIVENGQDSFAASATTGVTLKFWYGDAAVP